METLRAEKKGNNTMTKITSRNNTILYVRHLLMMDDIIVSRNKQFIRKKEVLNRIEQKHGGSKENDANSAIVDGYKLCKAIRIIVHNENTPNSNPNVSD
jgi:hypothetical protein